MAFEKLSTAVVQSFTAASDMTASSMQFCFVEMASNGSVHLANANTDTPVGVLQNLPARGELADVCMMGITKLRASGTDLTVGQLIALDSTSRGLAITSGTSTGFYVAGRVIQIDAADNDGALVTAAVNCMAPCRNA